MMFESDKRPSSLGNEPQALPLHIGRSKRLELFFKHNSYTELG